MGNLHNNNKYIAFIALIGIILPITTLAGDNTHSLDLELDSSQYTYAGDSADLSITGDLTIEFWIKPESNTYYTIIDKSSYIVQIFNSAGDGYKIYLYIRDNTTSAHRHCYWDYEVGLDTWKHITITYDLSENKAELYINSVSQTQKSMSGSVSAIKNEATVLNLGAYQGPTQFFDGLLDEVRIWNDIRTLTEISDNDQLQLQGDEVNLIAYWTLNNTQEDKGETTDPAGSDSDDLTLVNSPIYSEDVPFEGNGEQEEEAVAWDFYIISVILLLGINVVLMFWFFNKWLK